MANVLATECIERPTVCRQCLATSRGAATLAGTHLRAPSRRLLLEAAAPGGRPSVILPHAPGVAAQHSTQRAVAMLVRRGLVAVVGGFAVTGASRVEAAAVGLRLAGLARGDDERVVYAQVAPVPGRAVYKTKAAFRLYRRTLFGDELVKRYHRELESGARLRWDNRVQEAAAVALDRCGHLPGRSSSF